MKLISYKIFSAEMSRLKQLSLITPFSFSETRKNLIKNARQANFDKDTQVILDETSQEALKSFQVIHRLTSQAPRYLRELLFTRAISALELFLIDSIKEIAKLATYKFKSEEKISLSREQLFSTASLEELLISVVEQDCRQLSSGGFQEITKYYRNKLEIDYRTLFPGLSILEEYHERRHLLVHKLGQVDDKYRHTYNSTAKNLTVDKDYLKLVLDNLAKFGQELNNFILKEAFNIHPQIKLESSRYLFVIEINNEMPSCLKPTYELIIDSGRILLSSFMLTQSVQGKKMILALEGTEEVIMKYLEIIRLSHLSGEIVVTYINPKKYQKIFKP